MKPVYAKTQDTRLAGIERRVRFLERREQIPNPLTVDDLGGGGIDFDQPNVGGYLDIETNDVNGSFGFRTIVNSGDLSFTTTSTTTGEGDIEIIAQRNVELVSTRDIIQTSDRDITLQADRDVSFRAVSGEVILQTGTLLRMLGLPTSDPAVSGAVWNDSGTLKISP